MVTSVNARVNFRLEIPYILKMLYHFCLINQNLYYYLRLLLHENDDDSAIPAADSDYLGYRKFVSDFRTKLISLVISFLP